VYSQWVSEWVWSRLKIWVSATDREREISNIGSFYYLLAVSKCKCERKEGSDDPSIHPSDVHSFHFHSSCFLSSKAYILKLPKALNFRLNGRRYWGYYGVFGDMLSKWFNSVQWKVSFLFLYSRNASGKNMQKVVQSILLGFPRIFIGSPFFFITLEKIVGMGWFFLVWIGNFLSLIMNAINGTWIYSLYSKALSIVRAELKRRECNAMGHAFVCIRRPFEFWE